LTSWRVLTRKALAVLRSKDVATISQGPRLALLMLLLLAVCLGVSACGDEDSDEPAGGGTPETTATAEEPPTLDAGRVEAELKRNLDGVELFALPATIYPGEGGPPEQSQVGGGRLRVRSVTCPPDVRQE
jgi:hypothetical protein